MHFRPTQCKNCRRLLKGISRQGLQCRDCKYNACKACVENQRVPADCPGDIQDGESKIFIILLYLLTKDFLLILFLAPDVEMDTGPNAATEMLIDEGPDTPDEPRDPIDDLTSRINNKYV